MNGEIKSDSSETFRGLVFVEIKSLEINSCETSSALSRRRLFSIEIDDRDDFADSFSDALNIVGIADALLILRPL